MTKYKAVIFDLAGTLIDHGSCAPVSAFVDMFHAHDIKVDASLVRSYMGLGKREHLAALIRHPRVRSQIGEGHLKLDKPEMLDHLYASFLDFQVEAARDRCVLIEGVAKVIQQLQASGTKVGITTGYPIEVVDAIRPQLQRCGLPTDVIVTASDVAAGRPAPWMICRAAEALGVYPMHDVIVVDDTQAGVQAGMNAGCRTIGVSRTGNLLGLSEMELRCIVDRREAILAEARRQLKEAGADQVLESVADFNDVIEPAA